LLTAEADGRPWPPNPLGEGAEAFQSWLGGAPPTAADRPAPVATLERGVNLVARCGEGAPLDELADALARALAELGVPVAAIGLRLDGTRARLEGVDPRLAPYDTSLVCLNPVDLVRFAFQVDAEFFARRRSIGLWLAEETPAPDLAAALGFLDELWVPSETAARGLRARAPIPVRALPLPVETGATAAGRAELGLPEGPLVLTVCDLGDVFATGALERANPLGLVDAFERAFPEGEGPVLAVRLVDGGRNRYARERVRLASGRRDVLVLDGPLSGPERRALVRTCDCYASLHRAADFELACAEALAAGKPVVATATETLRALAGGNGALFAPAGPAPVPEGQAAYWTLPEWDEPDVASAAGLLRRAFERPDEARRAGEHGRAAVDADGSHERLATFLAAQLGWGRPHRRGRLARLRRRTGGR
jgi:glycosyltransferase involved in cell wall biosynthesis